MRVIVYGYGSMGRRHAANAKALGHEVHVVDPAILVPPRSGLLSAEGYRCHYDDAVDFVPDAVVIATPARTHAEIYRAVYKRWHEDHWPSPRVLLEKPVALSMEDYVANSATHAPLDRVGYNLRFHPGLRKMRERVKNIGWPVMARFLMRCDKRTWSGRDYEDMLLESSHEIDVATWMFGPADVAGATGSGDRWLIVLQHESGAMSTIELDGGYFCYIRKAEMFGPSGGLKWDWGHTVGETWGWDLTGPGCPPLGYEGEVTPEELYRDELRAFLGPNDDECCTVPEALHVLRLVDRARRSAAAIEKVVQVKGGRC